MSNLNELLDHLWQDYIALNPQAKEIYDLLVAKGENLVNDHIAFRTYNHPKINIKSLSRAFIKGGYEAKGNYDFELKKLNATHFEHKAPNMPRVFISELRLEEMSFRAQNIIADAINQIDDSALHNYELSNAGRLWDASYENYEKLLEESEYAAWFYAFGFRANHFTIFINALNDFDDIHQFNDFIKDSGYALNDSGGEVKGSAEQYLEQSSTLANEVKVSFSDGYYEIPFCYYEFAKRYQMPNGELFNGFIAKSADKIFESTNVNR